MAVKLNPENIFRTGGARKQPIKLSPEQVFVSSINKSATISNEAPPVISNTIDISKELLKNPRASISALRDMKDRNMTDDERNEQTRLGELYSMSSDDIIPHLENADFAAEENKKKIAALKSEKNTIQTRMQGYSRGGLQYTDTFRKDNERLNQIAEEIKALEKNESTGVAYTKLNGEKITWQDLFDSSVSREGNAVKGYTLNSLNLQDKTVVESAAKKVHENRLIDLTPEEKHTLIRLADEMNTKFGRYALREYTGKNEIDMFDALWWLTGASQIDKTKKNDKTNTALFNPSLQNKKRAQDLEEYNLPNTADFEKYVKIGQKTAEAGKSATTDEKKYEAQKEEATTVDERENGDPNEGFRAFMGNFVKDYSSMYSEDRPVGAKLPKFLENIEQSKDIYAYISDEERDMFYYYLGKSGVDAADRYAASLKGRLESRKAYEEAKDNGFWGDFADTAKSNFKVGTVDMGRGLVTSTPSMLGRNSAEFNKMLFGETYDDKLAAAISANSDKRTVAENMIIDATGSIAQQAFPMLLGAITRSDIAYYIAMSAQIIGGQTQEALHQGYSAQQGFIHGVIESALETGIDKALGGIGSVVSGKGANGLTAKIVSKIDDAIKTPWVANALARTTVTLGTAGSEGVQEFIQQFAEPVVRNVVYGEQNKYDKETLADAIYAFAVGFLSGGIQGAPFAGRQLAETRTKTYGEQIVANKGKDGTAANKELKKTVNEVGIKGVISLAKVSGNNSELYQKVNKQYETGEKINPSDLARLYQESAYRFIEKKTSEVNKAVKKKVMLEKISVRAAELLQTVKNGGIITDDDIGSTGGNGNGRLYNERTVGRNAQEPTVGENDTGTETASNGSAAQVQSDVEGRTGGTAPQNQRRRTVNFKKSSVNYTEAAADNSDGYRAYSAFKNAGIKAVYCDGAIERTVGGETVTRTEAFVAPDGTVFVSNMSTLPAKETFDHERVHIEQRNDSAEYLEYEDILLQNADFDSVTYLDIAKQINENQFNGKYDVEDINNIPVFMREVAAYINQYVLSDPEYAERLFGGMFTDWNTVVEAVHKFNEEMGAEFDDTLTDERRSGGAFGELSDYLETNAATELSHITQVFNRFINDESTERDIEFLKNSEIARRLLQEFAGEISEINATDTESAQERDTGDPLFREPSSKEIYRPRTSQDHFDYMTGREVNSRMKQAESIVVKLGLEIKWSEKTDRGYFDRKNNTVVLNPHMTATAMYVTILKHEFCHRLETKKLYNSFLRYVYDDSIRFKEYCRQKYAKETGSEFGGSDQAVIQWAVKETEERYKRDLPSSERKKVDEYYAKQELLADFVGDVLLGGQDIESTMQALDELAEKNRNVFERFRDFIRELIAKIKGDPHYLTLEQDLEYLEQYIARVYDSKDKKTAAKDSGVRYSVSSKSPIDLSGNNELSQRIGDKRGSAKYKEIQNYILEVLAEQPITLSDGTEAIVDRSDAQHLARGAGSKKTTQISEIKKIVETAVLVAEEESTKERKFDYFNYYEAYVKFGEDIYPIYLNVGHARNDGTYHIYDITQKIRDTAHRLNGVGRPVGNAMETISLNNSISNDGENVKGNNTADDSDTRHSLKTIKADFGDIDKFAGRILRQNRSSYDRAALTETLNEVLELANDNDYGQAMNRAYAAARNIIDYSKDTEQIADDAQEILNDIRNTAVRLTSTQKLEAGYAYGGYGTFHKKNFGRLKITENGVLLETKWQEWAAEHPELFDAEMVPEDMPVALANIVEQLKGQYVGYDTQAAAESLAGQIFNEAFNRRGSYTNEELLEYDWKMRQKHNAEMGSVKRQLRESEKKNKAQKRMVDEYHEKRQKIREEERAKIDSHRTKQDVIKQIRRDVNRIEKKLRANSEKKHVPEKLKSFVEEFCRVFVREDTSVFDRRDIFTVCTLYSRLGTEYNNEEAFTTYDEEIRAELEELADVMKDKTLRELGLDELLTVKGIVDNVSHMISYEELIFTTDRVLEKDAVADEVSKELEQMKTKKQFFLIKGRTINDLIQTPDYFFEQLGKTLKGLFDEIKKGDGKIAFGQRRARAVIADIKERYHYDDWAEDEPLKFTTHSGVELEITREQALLIDATIKRQQTNKAQGAEHVNIGGFVKVDKDKQKLIKRIRRIAAEKRTEENGRKLDRLKELFFDEVDSAAYQITPDDFAIITEWLTDEQRGYADEMVQYLSKDMAELGNETSMMLFGIKKFNEEYYIPYTSAANFLSWQPGVQDAASVKHMGMTRDLVKGANNPLLLLDFSEVCVNHIEQMLKYNALAVPIDNLTRVINSKTTGADGKPPRAIQADIERVAGENGMKYIKQLMDDISGNPHGNTADDITSKMLGRFKKNAVAASLSVVVQQPTAIARAFLYIPAKYFVKTSFKLAEQSFEQMKNWVPEAIIKEMGGHDLGLGSSSFEYIFQPKKTVLQRIDDVTMYAAAKADTITWGQIWSASKAYIADTRTDLEVGSEEFYKAAGEFCSEVINKTQVYDSTLTRSEIMRSKSAMAKMATAFMSEPILTLNMLEGAARKALSGEKGGKKFLATAIGCFVAQVAYNAAMKSIVYAMRDDDEEETYLEKYLQAYSEAVLDDLTLFSYFPYIKDIESLAKGYDVTRTDMDLYADLIEAAQSLDSDNIGAWDKVVKVAGAVSAVFGIPVRNIERDMRGIYNTVRGAVKGEAGKNTAEGITRAIETGAGEALNWLPFVEIETSKTSYFEEMAEAADAGNEKAYQKAYAQLVDMGEDEDKIRSGIRTAYRKGAAEETEKITKEVSNNKTYTAFDEDDKEAFGDKITSLLSVQKTEAALGNIEKFDKLYEYKRNNQTKYKEYKKELKEQGLTDSQISDGIELARLSYMKSIGIDIHEYVLYKIATSKKNADTDESGGVSNRERNTAIDRLDVSRKAKTQFKDLD